MDDRVMQAGRGARGAAQVFDHLRSDIITLKLEPGAVLSRTDLQERFRLSSTPVRDALMRLQEERLVEIFPQHATRVAPIDLTLAREAQFLRRSVEIELVRTLALKPDPDRDNRLSRLIQQQAAFAELGEFEAFAGLDHSFHLALYEACGVPDLWRLVRQRGGHIDRLRRLHLPVAGKMREIIDHHTAIARGVAEGNPVAAEEAMRAHLSRSLDFVETLRQTYPQYFRD